MSVTVLLELEGVMRGFNELPCAAIHRALSALCSYANVVIEDRGHVVAALKAFERGSTSQTPCSFAGMTAAAHADVRQATHQARRGDARPIALRVAASLNIPERAMGESW